MYFEYLKSFFYGILFGIPFCLAAGPVFFLLIQAGVNKGIKFALVISYGVVLADFILINVTYFFVDGIHDFIINHYSEIEITIAILLLIMGLVSILKKVSKTDHTARISKKSKLLFFSNGFMLNLFNPSNALVWIGANSKLVNFDKIHHLLFYTAALLTIATLMILISFLSKRIQPYLTEKTVRKMNIILGVVYILFSLSLLIGGEYLKSFI